MTALSLSRWAGETRLAPLRVLSILQPGLHVFSRNPLGLQTGSEEGRRPSAQAGAVLAPPTQKGGKTIEGIEYCRVITITGTREACTPRTGSSEEARFSIRRPSPLSTPSSEKGYQRRINELNNAREWSWANSQAMTLAAS